MQVRAEIVIVDGNMKFDDMRFYSIIKGDDKSMSIAAASIVAKVTRDRIMEELSSDFPIYKWHKNSGYGTKDHIDAIVQNGRTIHHRKTFKVKGVDY
jgi:ribonuclease HII